MSNSHLVLWVYIVLLEIGGLIGFLKAKSPVSLVMSSVFAAALIPCALGIIAQRPVPLALIGALLVVFVIRLTKTRKFMPAGLMLVLSMAALTALLVLPA